MKHASRRIRSLVVLVALLATSPVFGQSVQGPTPADGASAEADSDARQATVIIDGQPLFVIRGVSAFPATSSMTLEDQPGATWILAGGSRLLAVTDEDAALESVNRRLMAQVYSAKIAEAINAYRKDRDPAVLLQHGSARSTSDAGLADDCKRVSSESTEDEFTISRS